MKDKTHRRILITMALVAVVGFGITVLCIKAAHSQSPMKTNTWFDIQATMPSVDDVAGVYFMYRLDGDTGPYTFAGHVDAGPDETVSVRVADAPNGKHRLFATVHDNSGTGNLSTIGVSIETVEVDKIAPDSVVPKAVVPLVGDVNGDGKVDAVDTQLVINAALGL